MVYWEIKILINVLLIEKMGMSMVGKSPGIMIYYSIKYYTIFIAISNWQ